MEELESMTLTN